MAQKLLGDGVRPVVRTRTARCAVSTSSHDRCHEPRSGAWPGTRPRADDDGVTVAAPYPARLRYLRHMTLWTLQLSVGAVFVGFTLELFSLPSAPLPVVLVMAAAVVWSCAVSAYLMIASVAVGGPQPMTRRVWIAFGWAVAAALIAPVVAAPLYSPSMGPPVPWLVLPGLLTAAAVAGSALPRFPTAVVGTVLAVGAGAAGAAIAGREVVPAVVIA